MTQAERDRLVALKKAKKKLITQKQAADELGITERHVRRRIGHFYFALTGTVGTVGSVGLSALH